MRLAPPLGACRICGATTEQSVIGRERLVGTGQRLIRCGVCAGGWLDPPPTPGSLTQFYTNHYRHVFTAEAAETYDAAFFASLRARRVALARAQRWLPAVPPGGRILEVGSGFGAGLAVIAAERPDLELLAVEPDVTHRTQGLTGAAVTFLPLEAVAAAGPFDAILLFHVLEHAEDPVALLAQLSTCLAPAGALVVEVPDAGSPWGAWSTVHAAHLSLLTDAALDRLSQRVGLAIEDRQPVLTGTLFRRLVRGEAGAVPSVAPALAAFDQAWAGARDTGGQRVRRWMKRWAVRLVGPQRLGAWQRRRLGEATDRALEAERAKPADWPPRQWFLGLPLDGLTREATLAAATTAIRTRAPLLHADVNVAKLIQAQTDPVLAEDVASADLISADGMGVVWGARLLGLTVPERVTGIDLMADVIAACARHGWRPAILGAEPAVLAAAEAHFRAKHPALEFAICHHGYFPPDEEAAVMARIQAAKPDCLFVAMPSPRKERLLARWHRTLGIPFVMGVGGSVDVFGGKVRRAPLWMQRHGLEWAYRFAQEPRRLGSRYVVTNFCFAVLVMMAWLKRRLRT
ncbi:MAG: WecB/TagA/CpsF family glycosyltransferase [Alphaproteobacteria bacterium]|nr:MAG: WecB/TagA/CpsF family glycosyltransferase [Alphaproteobacteria bacterium]